MKKIIVIVLIILLIALGLFFFFGKGKEKIQNFFTDNSFGEFFDIEQQSQNDFIETPTQNNTQNQDQTIDDTKYVAPVLRQISFEPISGYTTYSTTTIVTGTTTNKDGNVVEKLITSTSTAVRFQERATGHIYDVFEFIQTPQKVSNITKQKIYTTIFSNNKDQFLNQTLSFNNEQVQTAFLTLVTSTSSEPTLQTKDVSSYINDFTYNKKSNKLFYSVKQDAISTIYSSSIDRSGEKAIMSIPFNEFLIDIINSNEILITSKASQLIPGYAYVLNLSNGSFDKILGNTPGLLVKVSPDKKYYIYSQSNQSKPSVRLYNTTTKTTNIITIDTLPSEKCVFSEKNTNEAYCFGSLLYKPGKYPDDWYKGRIFNIESLYKINLNENLVELIYSFDESGFDFDVISPQITSNDQFVLFENKYDLTLWSLDLSKLSNEF